MEVGINAMPQTPLELPHSKEELSYKHAKSWTHPAREKEYYCEKSIEQDIRKEKKLFIFSTLTFSETIKKSEEQQLPPSKEPPKFLSPIKSLSLSEGQHALLDCKFTPVDDPNLKIAWLLNGKALLASSRITTVSDFGYAVLEINPVTVFDHGEYTVVAVNQLGEARQSAILDVHGKEQGHWFLHPYTKMRIVSTTKPYLYF